MSFSAKAVANYFLDRAERERDRIDPMKLQKLVYFAHGWHLAIHSEPLIDETVEAWPYGPVIPTLYHAFKQYGAGPIRSKAVEFDGEKLYEPSMPPAADRAKEVLQRVWETYGQHSGVELSNLSHRSGSPWDETWQEAELRGKRRGLDIPDERIESHFQELAARQRRQAEYR